MAAVHDIDVIFDYLLDRANLEFMLRFSSLKTYGERTQAVYEILKDFGIFPDLPTPLSKSAVKALDYIRAGNILIEEMQPKRAIKFYSNAIAWAPPGSKHLLMAYCFRSEVLSSLKNYQACLMDTLRAIEAGDGQIEKEKLEKKQKICEKLILATSSKSKEDKEYGKKILTHTSKRHPEIPCASDNVKIGFNKDYGRHIVTTAEVLTGTVLAIDEPYVPLLHTDLSLARCSYCCRPNDCMIPCESCPFVLYCDDKCKKHAYNEYHRVECGLLHAARSLNFSQGEMLSLRSVIKAKFDHGSWEKLEQIVAAADDVKSARYRGFVKVGSDMIYDSKKFTTIHMLETNVLERSVEDMLRKSTTAAIFLYLLNRYSTILVDDGAENRTRSALIVGSLLLRHILTAGDTAFHTEAAAEDCEHAYTQMRRIAIGQYCLIGLLHHSCTPNVFPVSIGTSVALMALQRIKKGEQLFGNFGLHFEMEGYEERRVVYSKAGFKCNCIACKRRWPTYNQMTYERSISDRQFLNSTALKIKLLFGDTKEAVDKLKYIYKYIDRLDSDIPCKEGLDYQRVMRRIWNLLGNTIKYEDQTL